MLLLSLPNPHSHSAPTYTFLEVKQTITPSKKLSFMYPIPPVEFTTLMHFNCTLTNFFQSTSSQFI